MSELKISDTIIRVSKLFLQFLETPMDFDDMFEFFNNVCKTPVYSKEVLNKYLNTLRAAGLRIERLKGGKYYLYNFLTAVNLNEKEIEAYKKLEISVLRFGNSKDIKTFLHFKRKMIKFFDENTQKQLNIPNIISFSSELNAQIKIFRKICEECQKIKIKYENKIYIVEPKEILFIDNLLYLECYNTNQSKKSRFPLNKITLLEREPSKNTEQNFTTTVLYELSGKLAHNYKLKEGESIIAEHDSKIFVKAVIDDYEFLARRLIRYKNLCKIIKPVEFREYFIDYTNKILDIYKDEL